MNGLINLRYTEVLFKLCCFIITFCYNFLTIYLNVIQHYGKDVRGTSWMNIKSIFFKGRTSNRLSDMLRRARLRWKEQQIRFDWIGKEVFV